jgi:hypothetical protein
MAEPSTDVIQGTLDLLILKTLSLEPMHGFGIGRRVEQMSRGVFKVNPGSLLTALNRLERPDGSMRSGSRRRTRAGRNTIVSPAPEESSSRSRPPTGPAVHPRLRAC